MEDNIKQSEADKGLARSYAWPNKFRREIGFDVTEQLKARSIEFKKEENLSRQRSAMNQLDHVSKQCFKKVDFCFLLLNVKQKSTSLDSV